MQLKQQLSPWETVPTTSLVYLANCFLRFSVGTLKWLKMLKLKNSLLGMLNNFVIYFHSFFFKNCLAVTLITEETGMALGSNSVPRAPGPHSAVSACPAACSPEAAPQEASTPPRCQVGKADERVCDQGDGTLGLISCLHGRQEFFLFRKVV